MSRRSRPNRGGGEVARALKAAERGRGGGRRGRGGASGTHGDNDNEPPKWMATMPNALGERYVPPSLSSASVGASTIPAIAQYAANSGATGSSGITFMPLNTPSISSSSNAPAPVIYRSSVHGVPQAVEVSDSQLINLAKAITATRAHDFSVQNALLAGSMGAGEAPLFGEDLGTPLFGSDPSSSPAAPASSPSAPASGGPLLLASTAAPPGSLIWLRTQVGHALESLQFRRRLVKAAQLHVITPQQLQQGFASHRELMAQLQDFRTTRSAQEGMDHVQLVQRATQAAIDWLLIHAAEADLPKTFAAHAQRLTVVDTSNDAAVSLDVALHEKVKYIQDLGLGFSRVDIIDAFHQVAGDYSDLTSAAKSSATKALDALDENLVLWVLMDWFDLRGTPTPAALAAASALSMSDEDRREVIDNESIVVESMYPEVLAKGRTQGSVRIPVKVPDLPDGGFLEVAHPAGNLYPLEPPLLIFTHPDLSVAAKRSLITALYAEAWNLVGEPMTYNLMEWLQSNLFPVLRPLYPDEMANFSQAAQEAARERARLEKEGTAEYKKKQAKIQAKERAEQERQEKLDSERRKVDKEFAAKKQREGEEAVKVVSKRIGAAVGVFDRIRKEEEDEDEKRRTRIEQMKAILEAEANPNSSPTPSEENSSLTDAPASLEPQTLDTNLLVSFPGLSLEEESDANQSLLEEKDSLEINALNATEDTEALFKPQPIDHKLSQQLLRDWTKTKSSKRYLDIYEKRKTLPAQLMKDDIIRMIQSRQVVVISGSTGCGKSTQTPQFILDACIEAGQGAACNIVCTQPRRLAAIAVAERVAAERAEKIGDTVGYSIRLENKRSSRTRLLFCTTGILLRNLEGSPDLKGISHIIVDEVHERSIDSDFLLIILKGLLSRRPDLKLILMSATLNADIFTRYFEGCDTIDIPGRAFPVKSLYLEDAIESTKYEIDARSEYARKEKGDKKRTDKGVDSSSTGIKLKGGKQQNDEAAAKIAQYHEVQASKQMLDSMRYIDAAGAEVAYSPSTLATLDLLDPSKINYELIVELVKFIVSSNQHVGGSILIFLSGMQEISTLVKELKRDPITGNERTFSIYPLHSLLSSAEQQRVFDIMPPGSGRTKVVISTNIAETSLTIEDVTVVIDSGKMKEMQYDSKSGMSQLVETNVSQANARQRAGRAGRVRPGTCYYLYTQYKSKSLPAQQLPEMLRAPLEQLCLRIKSLNLGSISAFLSRAIEPPSAAAIDHVVEVLRNYNALERREEVLTPLGFHLAALPVDARIGKMMM